ncbi:hypothetical protein GCM10022377_13580 [Zhihengliuella alba]|uniref:PqqD family peptide modification chaperone n=1 Tax=Zhihengliuella alba TaxID=547018 RepID=A0ABP7D9T8_9MICC
MSDSSVPGRPDAWRFRARAAAGTFAAAGLDEAESRTLETAWSRCRPVLDSGVLDSPVLDSGHAEDGLVKHPGHDWEGFHERLVYTATGAAIASGRGEAVMLHGAALALPESGATIALVAASGVGKTTATRVLGRHFGYLTDETVVVREDGGIVPFPKPLSLLPPSGRRPKRQAGPDELGLLPAPEAPVLRRVAVLDRRESAPQSPTATRMPLSEALEYLAPQTSSLSHLPRGLCRLAELLDACGGALRLTYAESETLVPLVRRLLSAAGPDAGTGRAAHLQPGDAQHEGSQHEGSQDGHEGSQEEGRPGGPAREWAPLPLGPDVPAAGHSGVAPAAGGDSGGGAADGLRRYRRQRADDAIAIDDALGHSLSVLIDEKLVVLRGLGPLLWELTAEPRTPEELLAGVVAAVGEHPDGARLLDEQLETLVEHGVLVRS